jgi:hypothetical protein
MPTNDIPGDNKAASQRANFHAVRVHRIEGTAGQFVRMLSPDYKGIFTHFYQKRSHYCSGETCRIATHASDRTWKGYVAAELLLRAPKPVWVPICLEITEYLELDLRGIYQRGQLWELYKMDDGKGKKAAITGRLHADQPPADLRKPFDIVPCLRALYHRDVVDLKHASPLPPRVFMEEVDAELPEVLRQPAGGEKIDTRSTAEAFADYQRQKAQQAKSPTEERKKKGY